MTTRLTFLSHFVICLVVAAGAYFAHTTGVFAAIWNGDTSMMTSLIGLLFVGTAARLAVLAWRVDGASAETVGNSDSDPSIGHLAERLSVMFGFIGTAVGLSLQAKALAGGSTSFSALATSLFTTACGGVSAAIIAVMTYSLEAGARRTRRFR